jgi:hypothetical protein
VYGAEEQKSPYHCETPDIGGSVEVIGIHTVSILERKGPVEGREGRRGVVYGRSIKTVYDRSRIITVTKSVKCCDP